MAKCIVRAYIVPEETWEAQLVIGSSLFLQVVKLRGRYNSGMELTDGIKDMKAKDIAGSPYRNIFFKFSETGIAPPSSPPSLRFSKDGRVSSS